MYGTELMEWYQIHENHVFNLFETSPAILLQPLPRAILPNEGATSLLW